MYGEEDPDSACVHYWNAVKVDGRWYYVDPYYNNIYITCMSRDRVETDGNMKNLYFMISDTGMRQLYDGDYESIVTLYEDFATDQTPVLLLWLCSGWRTDNRRLGKFAVRLHF